MPRLYVATILLLPLFACDDDHERPSTDEVEDASDGRAQPAVSDAVEVGDEDPGGQTGSIGVPRPACSQPNPEQGCHDEALTAVTAWNGEGTALLASRCDRCGHCLLWAKWEDGCLPYNLDVTQYYLVRRSWDPDYDAGLDTQREPIDCSTPPEEALAMVMYNCETPSRDAPTTAEEDAGR